MLLQIPKLLNKAQLAKINELLDEADFADGRQTAGMAARRVKNNEEMAHDPKRREILIRIIMSSLSHNETFKAAVLPARMADPIFARYQPGMTYGYHVDDPVMGGSGPKFRTDVSMTLFLRDPESYDGGELVVRTSFGEQRVKMPAGGAVVYPSSSLHHVAPVTAGERLVALFWMQSHVRDPARREMLFELNRARDFLLRERPDEEATALVDKSFANLMRMWADV